MLASICMTFEVHNHYTNSLKYISLLTPDEGPSLETSIFPLSFQVVREPLRFAYHKKPDTFTLLNHYTVIMALALMITVNKKQSPNASKPRL